MDLITFSCKFGIGDEEYLTYYFGENCLLYSILKFYSLLDSHVTKAHTDASKIKYTIMTTDSSLGGRLLYDFRRPLTIENCDKRIEVTVSGSNDTIYIIMSKL